MTTGLALLAVAVLAIVSGGVAVARAARVRSSETGAPAPEFLRFEINDEAIRWAIRERETGNNPAAIGKIYKERSAYQFTASRWAMLTDLPFRVATSNPEAADWVAKKHLKEIRAELRRRGLEELPEFIAAAWHYGPAFSLSAARTEYARAVAALYWDRLKGATK